MQRAKGLRDTGMSRLRRRNRMCSSRVSGTAYRQGNGSTLCSPTEEKILCRSPFRSGLVSPIFAVPSKGKRKIHKKEKTAGCLLLVPSPGRRHHRWSQRNWHIHTSSIEYIHVKRNRQNCTKCPLNKMNRPAASRLLYSGASKDADFTENKMNRIQTGCSYIQTHPGKG